MSRKQQDVTRLLKVESDRVKMVELHPKEPLVICSLYSGQVTLWNYDSQTLIKSFEIIDLPVRCVKFITRLQSFICGSDDMCLRVYNYNTMEKTATFEAHLDYLRCIAVHDTLPLVLTSSDDMTVKMWDWTKNWACTMTFEGHGHYVMCVTFNPKDPSTFATASMDETIMVWNIHTPVRNFSLEGHENGVICVEYYPGGDKPYLISGSDDSTVRVWDYQTKACIQVLAAHNHNVTCVAFHPDLPLVFSGSEDENICTFSTQTWRLESTVCHNMGRAWCISVKPKCNKVALAFDRGLLVLNVGKDEPTMSMDPAGTIFFAQTNEIVKMNVKTGLPKGIADGEVFQLATKEAGTCQGMPRRILHGPGARAQYVAVLMDDDDYIVNSALDWRSKCFGHAIAFAWGNESGTFAILENTYTLKTFKQFKLRETVKLDGSADALYAGPVIGVRIDSNVIFYDWETLRVVRQITEMPTDVCWSDSGELCVIITDVAAFVLKYHPQAVADAFANGAAGDEVGLECAFDLVEEIPVKMRRSLWVGDCLLYVNSNDRLCYYIGGETTSLAVMPRGYSLLGYVAKDNRVYCIDGERNFVSYQLHTAVIEFKTLVVRGEMDAANALLPSIPDSMRQKVAEFLHARGLLQLAMTVTSDPDHRFDLAIQLGALDVALEIVAAKPSQSKWKLIGDVALEFAYFDVAERALRAAGDLNGLLLYYTSIGDISAIRELGLEAKSRGRTHVAFTCFMFIQDHDAVIDLLVAAQRYAEAAFHARTYAHHRICEVVDKWRVQMSAIPRVRDSLADPAAYPNLFPNVDLAAAEAVSDAEEPFSPPNSIVSPPPGHTPPPAEIVPPMHLEEAHFSPPPAEAHSPPPAAASPPKATTAQSPSAASPPKATAAQSPNAASPPKATTAQSPNAASPPKATAAQSPNAASPPKATAAQSPSAASPPKSTAAQSPSAAEPRPATGDEIDALFQEENASSGGAAAVAPSSPPMRDEDIDAMFEDES